METNNRKISSKKYLLAFILTLVIFGIGTLVGIMFENVRLNYANQVMLSQKVSLRSLQLQQKYIETGQVDCLTLNKVLNSNMNELSKKMEEVIDYEKKSLFNQEEFNLQLQDYFLTEIQYLLTAQEIDNKCAKDNLKIIYFYDANKYDTQGDILGYIKKLFGDRVLVFSFDSNLKQEPMVGILMSSYNITSFPSVVIDEKVFKGHTPVENLLEFVCPRLEQIEGKKMDSCEN